MRKEMLYTNENNNERFLKMNTKSKYRKLETSPIMSFNQSNMNLQIVSFLNKLLKTNLKEKNKKQIEQIKYNNLNIQTNFEIFNKIKSFNLLKTKIIIYPILSTIEMFQKILILCNNKTSENKNQLQSKNIKTINNKYEEENNIKEKILKTYINNNNDLLLSTEEFNKAYKVIKQEVTKNKYPVSSPIAITLGGQPGAGKSNIYEIARKRFSNNIVELDCDAFRIYHPYYKQIKKIFGNNDSVKTNPFIFKVVDLLIDELSNEKYNLIIESSLNSPNSALDNGKNLPPKGYKVELQIMATPKNISWQGTIDRYNKELKNGGNPRAVSKEFHDKVVENICNSLNIVKKSGLMSNIIIYDRNKTCLYNMKKDKNIDPCLLLYCIINGFFSKNNIISLYLFLICLEKRYLNEIYYYINLYK